MPLAVSAIAGNRNDVTQLLPLIDAIGPVAGKRVVRAAAPTRSTAIVGMTTTSTAARCELAAFLALGAAIICQLGA